MDKTIIPAFLRGGDSFTIQNNSHKHLTYVLKSRTYLVLPNEITVRLRRITSLIVTIQVSRTCLMLLWHSISKYVVNSDSKLQ